MANFTHRAIDADPGNVRAWHNRSQLLTKLGRVEEAAVRKTASFLSVLSLCLSRACLGNMIVLICKWLKNAVFRRRLKPKLSTSEQPGCESAYYASIVNP